MKICVLLFASLRDRFGTDRIEIDLSECAAARDVFDRLFQDPVERELWRKVARVAVNQAYVSLDTVLKEADEVALIPPVAGG